MTIEEILDIWSKACEKSGVKWFLFRESLLCAEGYGYFPQELKCAQVAVFSRDIQKIIALFPAQFPNNWEFDKQLFTCSAAPLRLCADGCPVLEIELLLPCSDEEQKERICSKVSGIKARLRHESKILKFFLNKEPAKYLERKEARTFNKLLSIAGETVSTPTLYSDHLTAKSSCVYGVEMFLGESSIAVNERRYPVFSAYRDYLHEKYGDYETGLHDEIGCGLSIEEKAELKLHQQRCAEALSFIQKLSEEHDLHYCLIAGSVLGAVRHGGFIPWDDDIDLGIRVGDIERFEALVKEKLPPQFTFMQTAPNHPYPRMFSKICYEGRCCIDLWPLVPTYKDGLGAIFTWYFGKLITKVHYRKIDHPVNQYGRVAEAIGFFMSDRMVVGAARYNERKFSKKNPPCYINLYSVYTRKKETFERNWIDYTAQLNFEGINVPVVGCTDEYLTHLYGDYMKLPAVWNRSSRHNAKFM